MAQERKKKSLKRAENEFLQNGKAKDRLDLLLKTKKTMEDEELTDTLAEMVKNKYGDLGFVLNVLKERPQVFNPYLFKGIATYREPVAISTKTAELIAVGASTALRCEYCLETHMKRAIDEGASLDEVMDAIMVAGVISESSAWSVAFRKYKQQEAKMKKGNK